MESAKYVVRRPRKGGHSIARVGVGMRAWMKRSSRPCLEAAAMALMHEVHCTPYALLTKCGTSSSRQMRARSSSLSTPRGAKHEVVESTQSTYHTRHTRKGGLCMGGLCASVRAQYCMHTCTCTCHTHVHTRMHMRMRMRMHRHKHVRVRVRACSAPTEAIFSRTPATSVRSSSPSSRFSTTSGTQPAAAIALRQLF